MNPPQRQREAHLTGSLTQPPDKGRISPGWRGGHSRAAVRSIGWWDNLWSTMHDLAPEAVRLPARPSDNRPTPSGGAL